MFLAKAIFLGVPYFESCLLKGFLKVQLKIWEDFKLPDSVTKWVCQNSKIQLHSCFRLWDLRSRQNSACVMILCEATNVFLLNAPLSCSIVKTRPWCGKAFFFFLTLTGKKKKERKLCSLESSCCPTDKREIYDLGIVMRLGVGLNW